VHDQSVEGKTGKAKYAKVYRNLQKPHLGAAIVRFVALVLVTNVYRSLRKTTAYLLEFPNCASAALLRRG